MPELHTEAEWHAIERSPTFRELTKRKRAFVLPATIFFLAWYFGFIFLTGYAPDFMGREFITDGLTVGYALALSQFVMTWVLGWMYMRRANRIWDPLAARVRDSVEGAAEAETRPSTRFRRGELVTEQEEEEVPQR
ncbi:MAG TPA: DUF485 domain-containing protein [Candidatus Limnocylindria bacterium]